jgi:hypothetical protein
MRILFLIFVALAISPCFGKNKIYISPNGNDKNKGSLEEPMSTLQGARDQIRSLKKIPRGGITVFLREGQYKLNETFVLGQNDSGTKKSPVKYSAYLGEKVSISGGVSISPEMVKELDPEESLFFDQSVRDNIKKIDLSKLGITDFGKIKNVGFSRPYNTSGLELFVNKKAFELSRYPNKNKIPMGKVIDPGSFPSKGDFSNKGGKFTYDDERPSRWKYSSDVWICGYFNKGWAEDAVQIAEIDTVARTFTTAQAHHYGFGSGASWKQWYAFNVLEEIDTVGEYFLNRETGVLYFYPDPENPIETLEVSMLEKPLVAMEGASNVTFSNITFECSRSIGIYIEEGAGNKIEACTLRNLGGTAICLGKGTESDLSMRHDLENSSLVSRQMGSIPQVLYNHTTLNRSAGENHGIINCHIYQVGAGGVILGGGDRKSLAKGGNYVHNCLIHDFNRIEKSYRAGIWITGVGNRISNCEIYDAPMMAILLHGNDHVIEYCDFHDVVREMHDQGAIYYGRNPSERGNVVRYNYFHDLGSEHLSVSVYHDDGACGMEVHANVFYRAGSMPVLIGGGNDHTYSNNIFINCPIGIHVDNRKQGWAKGSGDKGGSWKFEERLNAVDYKNPPYSVRYPQQVTYWEEDEAKKYPKNNRVINNVFYRVKNVIDGKKDWLIWENNKILDEAPSFWNEEKQQFSLQNGKIVYEDLSGFESIDFDKIGCTIKTKK